MAKRKKSPRVTDAEADAARAAIARQESAIADQIALGVASVNVAGKAVTLLDPEKRLAALDALEARRARHSVPVVEHLDDGWTL